MNIIAHPLPHDQSNYVLVFPAPNSGECSRIGFATWSEAIRIAEDLHMTLSLGISVDIKNEN